MISNSACSYHLKNLIKEYQPDCILIEGPIEANDQIPILTDEKTKSPIALYYSYKDEHGYISEDTSICHPPRHSFDVLLY